MKLKFEDGHKLVAWEDMKQGATYMEVGYDGEDDDVYLATDDGKIVAMGDGVAYDSFDFPGGEPRFFEVDVVLMVMK